VLEVGTLYSFHGEIGDAVCTGELEHPMGREGVARRCRPRLVDEARARGRLAEFRDDVAATSVASVRFIR
jgi:hypothetical protein